MCETGADHLGHAGDPDRREDPAGLTRRHFGGLVVGAAVTTALAGLVRGAGSAAATPLTSYDGLTPISNAMHIHTSFSEGQASLGAQISEAAANNVDALWKTDHDWREMAHGAPTHLGFTSLTDEQVAGRPVVWKDVSTGSFASKIVRVDTDHGSPDDADPISSFALSARSAGADPAALLLWADFSSGRVGHRTNLTGQTMSLDVYPDHADGVRSYLELRLQVSYRPSVGDRPAGRYQLSYRMGTGPAGYDAQQLLGVVTKKVALRRWQTVTFDPVADIARLWPDLVAEDSGLFDFWVGVTSTERALASGYVDNLRFDRTAITPGRILATEKRIKAAYAAEFPGVLLPRGREVSYYDRHMNAFGPQTFADYGSTPNVWSNDPGWEFSSLMATTLKQHGALVSFNHPFGTAKESVASSKATATTLQSVFDDLYANDVCHADILEVGYQERGSVREGDTSVTADLATHLSLWDMFSRNGFYLTGNGVSDDHTGGVGQWAKNDNRFLTYTWARSAKEGHLMRALSAGRVYVGELASFSGLLDLQVDAAVPMGAVSVRPDLTRRQLTVIAAGLPSDSVVQVVQGRVDYPGAATTAPGSVVVKTLPAAAFSTGRVNIPVRTAASSYVRVNVVTATGRTVAFSNPIWLLRQDSRRPIPAARATSA